MSVNPSNSSNTNTSPQQPQSPWVNSTFSVSISTPVEDLNIRLPSIQLPSGITSLIGGFAAQQQQQTAASGSTTAPVLGASGGVHQRASAAVFALPPNSTNNQPQQMDASAANPSDRTNPNTEEPPVGGSSSTSSPFWVRASSTPATLDTSGGSSSFSSGDSFVIPMAEGQNQSDTDTSSQQRVHRRHSHSSPPTAQRNKRHGRAFGLSSIKKEPQSGENQLTQRTTSTAIEGNQRGEQPAANVSGAGGDDSAEDTAHTYLRQRLRELFRRRHQLFWHVIHQSGEFPSLYAFGVLLCALLVLIVVIVQFFLAQFVACVSLLFAFAHYTDAIAFKKLVTGSPASGWMIAAKVLLRQFMVLSVFGQSQWVIPAAGLQPTGEQLTFWSALYIVILTQFLVFDLLLYAKLAVACLPFPTGWFGTATKRRVYQWIEYTGALYRFAIPFVQWNLYLDMVWWTVLYGGVKLLFGLALAWGWLSTTIRIFRCAHLGSTPTEAECKQSEQCTICYSEFQSPIKLSCSHIFCSECIRTWLDREVTCPICRAVVTREDNHYRNGDPMVPCLF